MIFHFYDDFSKPNLRMKRYSKEAKGIASIEPLKAIFTHEAWMTWSPSHTEMALLTELLSYANIVNGLGESQKKQLKNHLEGRGGHSLDILLEIGEKKKIVAYHDESRKVYLGAEICPEYIDYLKGLLKPYLK